MVEYGMNLDNVFMSLADATRRDILSRLIARSDLTVTEIASAYDLTYAAISKHLKVLENAKLVIKRKVGKEQHVRLSPTTLKTTSEYIQRYEQIWNNRFDNLEKLIKEEK